MSLHPVFAPEEIWPEKDRLDNIPEGPDSVSSAVMQAFGSTSYAIMIADTTPSIVAINQAFTTITGWRWDEVVGRNPSMLSSGRQDAAFYKDLWRDLLREHHWQGEIWNRRKDGSVFPEWLTIDAILDEAGELTHFVAVFADITQRKQESDDLERLAFHDALTGLPNRRLFEDRLDNALARARRDSLSCALLMIDLDGFKAINDSHGHDVGDHVLVAAGERLSGVLRASDTLARVGGDEFLALIPSIKSHEDAMTVAEKMLAAVCRPYDFLGRKPIIGASMGISIFPDHGEEPAEFVMAADRAMYQAKNDGKGVIRTA